MSDMRIEIECMKVDHELKRQAKGITFAISEKSSHALISFHFVFFIDSFLFI